VKDAAPGVPCNRSCCAVGFDRPSIWKRGWEAPSNHVGTLNAPLVSCGLILSFSPRPCQLDLETIDAPSRSSLLARKLLKRKMKVGRRTSYGDDVSNIPR
jgi:hypothetical protein